MPCRYKSTPGEETFTAVVTALRSGYRHVDTAQIYRNEGDVGRALKESGVPRSEVFVTTKLWLDNWGHSKATAAVKESLAKLQTDYIDLMLLHAPGAPETRAETWKALEECKAQGLIRDIGVSNFGQPHLERLMETATVAPAVNQIELHPWLQRRELVAYCQKNNIVVEAYSPLAKANKLSDPTVGVVAHRVGASPAQVLLAWGLAKDAVVLPKSVKPERQRDNLAAAKVKLSDEDIAELDGLEEGLVTGWDPIKDAPV